jgi:hypothetical protein
MFKFHPLVGKKVVEKKESNDEVERSIIFSTFENVIFHSKYQAMMQPKKGEIIWYIGLDPDNIIVSVTKVK